MVECRMLVKLIVTVLALSVGLYHLLQPSIQIDTTTLVLFIVALLPWISSIFRSVEVPGWFKVEFKDIQKAVEKAEKQGLLPGTLTKREQSAYSFQLVAQNDPNLALAGLRIEIEKRMKTLAEKHGMVTTYQGIGSKLNYLTDHGVMTPDENDFLKEITTLLNNAVHGAKIDQNTALWTIEYGPRILKYLDGRIKQAGSRAAEERRLKGRGRTPARPRA
jgi:hypothetical protein